MQDRHRPVLISVGWFELGTGGILVVKYERSVKEYLSSPEKVGSQSSFIICIALLAPPDISKALLYIQEEVARVAFMACSSKALLSYVTVRTP